MGGLILDRTGAGCGEMGVWDGLWGSGSGVICCFFLWGLLFLLLLDKNGGRGSKNLVDF